jgi:hypothetical protein
MHSARDWNPTSSENRIDQVPKASQFTTFRGFDRSVHFLRWNRPCSPADRELPTSQERFVSASLRPQHRGTTTERTRGMSCNRLMNRLLLACRSIRWARIHHTTASRAADRAASLRQLAAKGTIATSVGYSVVGAVSLRVGHGAPGHHILPGRARQVSRSLSFAFRFASHRKHPGNGEVGAHRPLLPGVGTANPRLKEPAVCG